MSPTLDQILTSDPTGTEGRGNRTLHRLSLPNSVCQNEIVLGFCTIVLGAEVCQISPVLRS